VFLEEGTFAFLPELKPELTHSYYCQGCHATQVEPELEAYRETLERAREVFFFFDTRKQAMPVQRKATAMAVVEDCADRDETILRLGFIAASQGFNAIVEGNVAAEKVRNHGWQKTRWRGRGWPAQVDAEKLDRHSGDY
jgi:hypothetical protein